MALSGRLDNRISSIGYNNDNNMRMTVTLNPAAGHLMKSIKYFSNNIFKYTFQFTLKRRKGLCTIYTSYLCKQSAIYQCSLDVNRKSY